MLHAFCFNAWSNRRAFHLIGNSLHDDQLWINIDFQIAHEWSDLSLKGTFARSTFTLRAEYKNQLFTAKIGLLKAFSVLI